MEHKKEKKSKKAYEVITKKYSEREGRLLLSVTLKGFSSSLIFHSCFTHPIAPLPRGSRVVRRGRGFERAHERANNKQAVKVDECAREQLFHLPTLLSLAF